jgi:hypothetical protein|tara:strand:- start:366 stop:524 length:159 start_codon:yes stop_codon:yes gene_type:complete
MKRRVFDKNEPDYGTSRRRSQEKMLNHAKNELSKRNSSKIDESGSRMFAHGG